MLKDYFSSGHKYVVFAVLYGLKWQLGVLGKVDKEETEEAFKCYLQSSVSTNRMVSTKFAEVLLKGPYATEGPPIDGETLFASTVSLITAGCEALMPHKEIRHRRHPTYW